MATIPTLPNQLKIAPYRDYNKIHLVCYKDSEIPNSTLSNRASKTVLKHFKGYLQGNFNLSYSAKFTDLLGSISTTPFANFLLEQLIGMSPYFSMDRVLTYAGAAPFTLTLNVLLKVQDSFETDIQEPLKALLDMALPYSTSDTSVVNLFSTLSEKAEIGAETSSGLTKFGNLLSSAIYIGLQTVVDLLPKNVQTYLDSVKPVNIPPMMENPVALYYGKDDSDTNACVFGPLMPMFIKSLSFDVGPLVLSGGRPETILASIGLDYGKTVERETFNSLFPTLPTVSTSNTSNTKL